MGKVTQQKISLESLKDKLDTIIWLIDSKGTLIDCNKATEKLMFEGNYDDLKGKGLITILEEDLGQKEWLPLFTEKKSEIRTNGSITPFQIKFKRADKVVFWLNLQFSLIRLEGKEYLQIFMFDATNLKALHNNIDLGAQNFQELAEDSHLGIQIVQGGEVKYINKRWLDMFGYRIEEITQFTQKTMTERIHPDDREFVLKNAKKRLKGSEDTVNNYEFRGITKSGKTLWLEIFLRTIIFEGRPADYIVIHDITEKKTYENALRKSESKLKRVLETSIFGVLEYNYEKNEITYVNSKFLEILGLTQNELGKRDLYDDIIYPEDREKFLSNLETNDIEFRIVDKDKAQKWLSGRKIELRNEISKSTGFRLWVEDITEKKMYQTLLYELSVNFLNFTTDFSLNISKLLNTAKKILNGNMALYIKKFQKNDAIVYQIITDKNNVYEFSNENFKNKLFYNEIFGADHDYIQTFLDIDMTKYGESDFFIKQYDLKGCYAKLIRSHRTFTSAICVLFKYNPKKDIQHKLGLFLIGDAIEIEQRRGELTQKLEERNKTLQQINKYKSELISRTSHELKTPLIAIKGFTDLLLSIHKSKLDEEVSSILQEVKYGSKRLEEIINSLLETSRLEQGRFELNLKKDNLSFLIGFTVKELHGLAQLRELEIKSEIDEDLYAQFDKERLYEVLSNLISNAIKFTPPGGTIFVKTEILESEYKISVSDTGIGITEEEKKQLFQQFGKIERYGQGWDVNIEGTGLGLHISKQIVNLHGGNIWVESEGRNKGSTFYFTIPKT